MMMKRQMTNSLVQSCHPVICDGRTLFDSRRLPDHDLQGFVISPLVIRYLASYYLLSCLFYWLSCPLDICYLTFVIHYLAVIRYLTSCYFLSCLLLFAISLLLLIIMPLVIHYLTFYYSLSCHLVIVHYLTSCSLLFHLFSFVISLYCYSLSHLLLFVIFNWPCLVLLSRACTKDNVEPTQLIRRQWFVKCTSLAYFERSVPLANRGRTLQSVFCGNV